MAMLSPNDYRASGMALGPPEHGALSRTITNARRVGFEPVAYIRTGHFFASRTSWLEFTQLFVFS